MTIYKCRNAWQLLLVRHDIRAEYEQKLVKDPGSTISIRDGDIVARCLRLLVSEFSAVASGSKLTVTMMKTVLSYVHQLSGSENLYDNDPALLYLAVPLLSLFRVGLAIYI